MKKKIIQCHKSHDDPSNFGMEHLNHFSSVFSCSLYFYILSAELWASSIIIPRMQKQLFVKMYS